jgi:hypothetical protein
MGTVVDRGWVSSDFAKGCSRRANRWRGRVILARLQNYIYLCFFLSPADSDVNFGDTLTQGAPDYADFRVLTILRLGSRAEVTERSALPEDLLDVGN